jgi:hypothetical protein
MLRIGCADTVVRAGIGVKGLVRNNRHVYVLKSDEILCGSNRDITQRYFNEDIVSGW